MDSGTVLSTQYDVVKTIFKHLSAFELKNAVRVCKLWRDVAKIVSNSRTIADHFYYEGKACGVSRVLEQSKTAFKEAFTTFLEKDLYSIPDVVVSINSSDYRQFTVSESTDFPYDYSALFQHFPKCSMVHLGSSYGVVSPTREIENFTRVVPCVSVLAFPKLPRVKIHTFQINDKTPRDEFNLVPTLKEEDDVKGLIVFTAGEEMLPIIGDLILKCQSQSSSGRVALGGTLGSLAWRVTKDEELDLEDMARQGEQTGEINSVCGLIFSGGVNLKSIILTPDIRTKSKVESELSKLKTEDFAPSHAFMFACCGRGKRFYHDSKDVESASFRKIFPNVLLLGNFSGGEIGFNHYDPTPSSSPPKKTKLREEEYFHSYTTVFILIAFE